MYDVPVLFLIFNRPDSTKEVFQKIREAKPERLYVAADGPRPNKGGEAEKCQEARDIVKNIDWECDVKTLFREKNLGCKNAVVEAINWFFESEEMGIILEDDCKPNNSFFVYCKEMLERYRDIDNIMMVSGDNFQKGNKRGTGSYYFSRFPHIWGWATWKRAWSKYSPSMPDYPKFIEQNIIEDIFPGDKLLQNFWIANFDKVYKGDIDTWDYQWVYTIFKNGGVSIAPNHNFISNIGFREDATHTKTIESHVANMPTEEIEKIVHPDFFVINSEGDRFTRDHVFSVPTEVPKGIIYRGFRKIKKVLWK